nr:CRE-NLP-19 protein [Haemonchus contortus]
MISRIYCLLCLIFILSAVPNATSQEVELYKRRIGMRLPNMVHLKPLVRKRRIGMRLPNIIYMRSEPAKKNIWEYE